MRRALRTASVLVLLSILGTTLPAAGARSHVSRPRRAELSRDMLQTLSTTPADRRLHVIVTLRGTPTVARGRRAVVATLRDVAETARADLMATLGAARSAGLAGRATPLWIANAVSVAATPRVIRQLATRPDVASIRPDAVAVTPAAMPEVNIQSIGAPTVWTSGADGSGVVVASLDSGVDATHPDLAAAFRGTPGDWYRPVRPAHDDTHRSHRARHRHDGRDRRRRRGGHLDRRGARRELDRRADLERRRWQLPDRDPPGLPVGARSRRRRGHRRHARHRQPLLVARHRAWVRPVAPAGPAGPPRRGDPARRGGGQLRSRHRLEREPRELSGSLRRGRGERDRRHLERQRPRPHDLRGVDRCISRGGGARREHPLGRSLRAVPERHGHLDRRARTWRAPRRSSSRRIPAHPRRR